ncbi:flagellar hook-basal body complex protein FliE [Calycomorphotria hydatis]|uniref:Flagellar hook-basal body complex protein FliE n=1 Tax=Calycomorphotria hydatis TaxID=2528027 RepID=A0A517TBA0_9PLAN|nr:flagellar hook-basal body complex protein FliE [Calycomorphotria hydatis]QDT65652.1 flagellar hook-basal body protein FliE [Calycomorphotria hydatis]
MNGLSIASISGLNSGQGLTLNGVSGLSSAPAQQVFDPAGGNQPVDFQQLLFSAMNQVNAMEQNASTALHDHLAGGDVTQVEVLSSFRKADLTMRMMLQVRNKLLEAFNEIKQMQM